MKKYFICGYIFHLLNILDASIKNTKILQIIPFQNKNSFNPSYLVYPKRNESPREVPRSPPENLPME